MGIELLIIAILILANGFFAGSEIAIVSARKSRLEAMSDDGNAAARQALHLADNPDTFLATVQVGITFIGTFSAAFGGAQIAGVLGDELARIEPLAPYADGIALFGVVAALTYFSLVVGELLPKRLALVYAEQWAVIAAPLMRGLSVLARPLVALLIASVNPIFHLLGGSSARNDSVTEEDIAYLVREGAESGGVEAGEAQLIHRVFQFTDRPLFTVMTPRTQMVAVSIHAGRDEIVRQFIDSRFSRLPVYDGSIDNVVGILYVKDALGAFAADTTALAVRDLMRPPLFVVESAHTDDLLLQLRDRGQHMALVIDEFGQVKGLVTLEDLIEELVGEIRDEGQIEAVPYFQRKDGSWLVDGMEPFDRVRERIGLKPLAEAGDDFSSLASVIIQLLEAIPSLGDSVSLPDATLEVVDMDGRRIDKVLIRKHTD